MPLPPKRDHSISLDEAAKLTRNFRESEKRDSAIGTFFKSSVKDEPLKAGFYHREAFDDLLKQEGCAGIRIYFAQKDDGEFTTVLVGVDAQGNDMTAMLKDTGMDCPPACSDDNALNK
jgi:hypothetical protein